MKSPLVDPCVLDKFVHHNIVLDTAINTWKEGLLYLWVYQVVHCEIFGESVGQKEVIGLSDASRESYHAKVCRVGCWTLFVNKFDD